VNGVRLLLDTNIIIYYLNGVKETKSILKDNEFSISYVTAIEIIGYWKNTKRDISSAFNELRWYTLDEIMPS